MNQPNASILLHVQRTTVEDAFIAVPVSADLLNAQPDGTGRIDGERLCLSTEHAELLVRRLLAEDVGLSALEVRAAGLAEAFTELTRDDTLAEAA